MKTIQRYLIVGVGVVCGVFGAGVALGSQHHHKHNASGFAVLARHTAHVTATQSSGLPSSAVLATTVGENKVYVYEAVKGLEGQVCVADSVAEITAGACNSATASEREGVDLILPDPKDNVARVVVLAPNGVGRVTFTKPDGSTTVAVVNNVAVAEGAITAYHYTQPGGSEQAVAIQR